MGARVTKPKGVITLRGKIEFIAYNDGKFAAGKMRASDGSIVSFAGPVYVRPEELVVWKGEWNKHEKYGWQFKISDPVYEQVLDVDGLAHYLANHPKMKGIGPVKAQKIAAAFGANFDKVINDEPERVQDLTGLSALQVANIRDEWNARRELNAALTVLSKYGLTFHQVTQLTKKFGNDATRILTDNPYLISGVISEFGFKRIDEMARKSGIAKNADCRLRAGILHCVNQKLDDGDCWIEHQDLIEYANKELILDDLDSKQVIEKKIEELVSAEKLACVSLDGRMLVAIPSIYKIECALANWFSLGAKFNPHFITEKDLEDQVTRKYPTLNTKQKEALLSALRFRQVLISGPAGAGKTFCAKALCEMYEKRGLKVKLAAPTGKAAKRLSELSGRAAMTIHRMIGFDGSNFTRPDNAPIEADVVVVDEVSMVDIRLAWELFKAIDLNRTCLVFLGDHHQLAPVGAGNILRDLVERKPIPTVILEQVVRQAGILRENSFKILQGQVADTSKIAPGKREPWYMVRVKDDGSEDETETAKRTILQIYENVLQDKLGFDLINDVQLLSPKKAGTIGVEQLNVELQKLIQAKLYNFIVPAVPAGTKPPFYVNDKVIQTRRNNYELDVMNGETGVVTAVGKNEITVRFGDREVIFKKEQMRYLELAYCLTIHKAQGSEWPCVISVIHKSHRFQHDRGLFYTAVTRAKETAIIIGDPYGVKNCAATQKAVLRKTFLSILPFKRELTVS